MTPELPPCHPVANLFPLLEGQELTDLVEDIRARGLLEPVIMYRNGDGELLLDGRNRWIACGIAGVKVRSRQYHGADPRGTS